MTKRVWCLGDAVVDLLPECDNRLIQCPGGAPANVAVGIARLQGNSGFIGKVGGVPFGTFLIDTLNAERVNTEFMQPDDTQRTSVVVVALDADGERNFTFMVRPSADLFIETHELPPFQAGEWLHCCSIALLRDPSRNTTLTAMQQLHEAGGFVSFDPNIRHDLWADEAELRDALAHALALADVVKLSEEELTFICNTDDIAAGMQQLAEHYAIKLVLVTQGRQGVQAWSNGTLQHYPARPVVSVDTTGAGDAFVAGLLWHLAGQGLPQDDAQLRACLERAQICGGLATTAKGAMTALPYLDQLHQQLA